MASDDTIHDALGEIGPDLPEPRAPEGLRTRIASLACAADPVVVPRRTTTWAMGAIAATLAVATGVVLVQNARLRGDVATLRASLQGGAVAQPASFEQAPLMVVDYWHEGCPVAAGVSPQIKALAEKYRGQPVLFVTLDVTESCASQTSLLAKSLGLESTMSTCSMPVQSGTVALVDTRTHEVIAACTGSAELPTVAAALDKAVATCSIGN